MDSGSSTHNIPFIHEQQKFICASNTFSDIVGIASTYNQFFLLKIFILLRKIKSRIFFHIFKILIIGGQLLVLPNRLKCLF